MGQNDGGFRKHVALWQKKWDRVKIEVKRRLDAFEPLVIAVYRSHAGPAGVRVLGRVLEEPGAREPDEGAGLLRNAINTVRRFESDEIPDARVRVRFRDVEREDTTDHEGFFEVTLDDVGDLEPGWHEVEVELLDSPAGERGVSGTGEIMVPPADAEYLIVSDIDDTVLETRATDMLTHLRVTLAKSPEERQAMPGAVPLYEMLEAGPDRDGWNPFIYVSNSGWGLYELMETFLETAGLPEGPIYLQDLAILEPKSPKIGAENHKRETIKRLLDDFPDLDFVLIGDSGQKDPETYRDLVEDHADRIRAVLIRDVAPPERDAEVREIIQEMVDLGVAAAAAESSVSLARAAADFGLIPDDAIGEVRAAMVEGQKG